MERRGLAIRLLLVVGALAVAFALIELVYALRGPRIVYVDAERQAARGEGGALPAEREDLPRTARSRRTAAGRALRPRTPEWFPRTGRRWPTPKRSSRWTPETSSDS